MPRPGGKKGASDETLMWIGISVILLFTVVAGYGALSPTKA